MIDNIIRADKEFGLFSGVGHITVAVSGGADSVAMLHGLNSLKERYGFSLTVAHYHHGIRGEEADRDFNFTKELAASLNLPFVFEKGNAVDYAEKCGISIETAARELRYDFLNRVAVDVIATAHTASDNLETVIFNMIRGASLKGICGIPPKRDNIIRPLIFCERDCIEKYCADNSLQFVTDSTNLVDDCSRNIIRHQVVPVLKSINPSCVKNISNLSRNLLEDNSYIQTASDKEFESRYKNNMLDISGFDTLPLSIAKRVTAKFYKRNFGVLPDMYHINKIMDVSLGTVPRTSVSFDKSALRRGQYLCFEETLKEDVVFSVKTNIITIKEFKNNKNVHGLLSINALDCDKISGKIRAVKKNNSDTVKLAGSSVTKTVKKLLTEKKIPIEYRANLPVYADDIGIVWIYGVGVADRVKIDKTTNNVMYIDLKIFKENTYGTE